MNIELKHKIYSASDCITEQTMFDYIDGKLSSKEEHVVEKHMIDCELCSDALEGLRLVKNRNVIGKINEDVRTRISTSDGRKPIDVRFLLSAAAGILLLAGGVFFFKLLTSPDKEKMAELNQAKEIPSKEIIKNEDAAPVTESLNKLREADTDKTLEGIKPPKADELEQSTKWKNQVQKETETGNGMSEGTAIITEETVSDDLQTKSAPDLDNNRNNNAPISTSSNTIINEPALADKKDQKDVLQRDDSKVAAAEKSVSGKAEEQNYDVILSKKKENKKEKAKDRAESAENSKQEISMNDEEKPDVAGNSGYWENNTMAQKPGDQVIADSTIIFSGALDPVYSVVEEMPKFPGGDSEMMKYILKNLKYPTGTFESGISGSVYVQFVVDKTGNIQHSKIFKSSGIIPFDNEILRVVNNMPKWTPGKSAGKPVNVLINLPVKVHPK
jgi:TonB family protein